MRRLDQPFERPYDEALIEYWIYAHDTREHWKVDWTWEFDLACNEPQGSTGIRIENISEDAGGSSSSFGAGLILGSSL